MSRALPQSSFSPLPRITWSPLSPSLCAPPLASASARLLHQKPSPVLGRGISFLAAQPSRPLAYTATFIAPIVKPLLANGPQRCRASRRTYVIEAAISAASSVLTGMHTLIPLWGLTIPFFGLITTAVFRWPLQLYERVLTARRLRVTLVARTTAATDVMLARAAWATHPETITSRGFSGTSDVGIGNKSVTKVGDAGVASVYALFGVQTWKSRLHHVSLPFMILGSEAVRRVSGAPGGLLSLASSWSDLGAAVNVPEIQLKHVADPGMACEGLGWFTDLSISDPLHILPIVFGISLVAQVIPTDYGTLREMFGLEHLPRDVPAELIDDKKIRKEMRRRRGAFVFSLAMTAIMWNMPAGMVLYWVSVIAWSFLGKKQIHASIPIENQLKILDQLSMQPNSMQNISLPRRK